MVPDRSTIPCGPRPRSLAPLLLLALIGLAGCFDRGADLDLLGPCTPESELHLEVGSAIQLSANAITRLCIGGGSPSDYLLVVSSRPGGSSEARSLTVRGEGIEPITDPGIGGPPAPAVGERPRPRLSDAGSQAPDPHHRIREIERTELTALIGSAPTAPLHPGLPVERAAPATRDTQPSEGDTIRLNTRASPSCEPAGSSPAVVRVVSESALLLEDPTNPPGGYTAEDFQSFATAYDTLVAPLARETFGEHTDLDENGRVILLFTGEVNRLSAQSPGTTLLGTFLSRDLFPPTEPLGRLQPCAGSNFGEVLYFAVPDPQRVIGFGTPSRESLVRGMPRLMVHELQHLINTARRIHITGSDEPFEETWLNEALSHTAEDLLFFRRTGLGPRMNIGMGELLAAGPPGPQALERIQSQNLQRFQRYLRAPEAHSPFAPVDGVETRGAAQQLLRYLLDRADSEDTPILRALIDGGSAGVPNLSARFGGQETLRRWLTDWHVALYADERIATEDPAFQLRSWNHPSLFEALNLPGNPFPLRPHPLDEAQPVTFELALGSAAYFEFTVPSPTTATLRIEPQSGAPDATLAATLLRLR